jgi:predicted transcriptional regulator
MSTLYESLPKEFVSQTAFFDYKTPLTQVLDEMNRFGAVIVTKDKAYFGIADNRTMSRTGSERPLKFSKALSIGKFARKLPLLNKDTSIGSAIGYFHEFSAKALPYGEGDKVKGVVKRDIVLRSIISLHLLSKAKVSDATSTPVLAIDSGANLSQAVSVMSQNRIRRLIVMDGGKLAGIITQGDIYSKFARIDERQPELTPEPRSLNNVLVGDVANANPHSAEYNSPLEDAIRQLLEKNISSLVVVRNAKPVGILSIRDVFELAAAQMEKVKRAVVITGIDESTLDYEQDMENEVNRLIEKIDKFGRTEVSYAAIHVNKVKNKGYELKARLGFEKKGVVFATATGYGLDSTLASLLDSLLKQVKERKEMILSGKREAERYYGEE